MFEEYLQDSYEFLTSAERMAEDGKDREARRYFRASIFYASGAMEAFVNYLADAFSKAGSLARHETSYLNDKALVFSVEKGLVERTEYHRIEDKIRLLIRKFAPTFSFQSKTWIKFVELKDLRDSLVHPRQIDDEMATSDYRTKVCGGLRAIIELMDCMSRGVFQKPLRKKLLDLMPD